MELSWLKQTQQKIVAELATAGCKVEMSKAQLLRQQADTLTADQIKEVLQNSTAKIKQQQVSISPDFYADTLSIRRKKQICLAVEAILEKALAMYFEAHN